MITMPLRYYPPLQLRKPLSLLHVYGRRPIARPLPCHRPLVIRVATSNAHEVDSKPSIGARIKTKIKEAVQGFILLMVVGSIAQIIPTWEETLDGVCRIVPPKTVTDTRPSVPTSGVSTPTSLQAITLPEEIRVLVIEPGSGPEEEIHCRIVNVAMSWRTRFEALSYTWGDERQRETIIVDGKRTSITKNLHSALVHLRDAHRERILWADALCINQDDLTERDEQVKKMGMIYTKARRVIIWLGEGTPEVIRAFTMMKEAAPQFSHWRRSDNAPIAISWDWSPVFALLRRPWFQRTWIIQEAVLAHEPILACGHETLPWQTLVNFCEADEFNSIVPPDDAEIEQALQAVSMITHGRHECHTKFIRKRKKKEKYTPDFKLVSTLYETRGFRCKDDRDKVYAVLSMVTNVGPEDEVLMPNSQASVEDVFQAVAQWDIVKNESLELLSYCSRKAGTHPRLPSWVPDFSDMDEAHSISFIRGKKPKKKKETSGSRYISFQRGKKPKKNENAGFKYGHHPFFFRENDKTVLVLSGKIVDTIARLGQVTENPKMIVYSENKEQRQGNGSGYLARLDGAAVRKRRQWLQECVQIALAVDPVPREKPSKKFPAQFWKSPTLGMSEHHFDKFQSTMKPCPIVGVTLMGGLSGYARFLHQAVETDPHWHQRWRKRHFDNLEMNFKRFFHKRRFCATKSGKMGWVPGMAAEGDLVCLVSGAQVPIILRKVSAMGRRERYQVVGDAFFHDLMPTWTQDVYAGGERLSIV